MPVPDYRRNTPTVYDRQRLKNRAPFMNRAKTPRAVAPNFPQPRPGMPTPPRTQPPRPRPSVPQQPQPFERIRRSGYEPTRQGPDPRLAEYQQQRQMMEQFRGRQAPDYSQFPGFLEGGGPREPYGRTRSNVEPAPAPQPGLDPRSRVPSGVPYGGSDPQMVAYQQSRQVDPYRRIEQRLAEYQQQRNMMQDFTGRNPMAKFQQVQQRNTMQDYPGPQTAGWDPTDPRIHAYLQPRDNPYADFEEPARSGFDPYMDLQQFNNTIRDLERHYPQPEPEPYRLSPWAPGFLQPEPEPEPAYQPAPWSPGYDLLNMLRGF